MNTLTPETESAITSRDEMDYQTDLVCAGFARKMELQRDDARMIVRECDKKINELMAEATVIASERDEARKTCAELVTDGNAITLAESLHKMEKERDQLRRVCDDMRLALIDAKMKIQLLNLSAKNPEPSPSLELQIDEAIAACNDSSSPTGRKPPKGNP